MTKVILRQKAIDDLNDIWLYTFYKWSEEQANKYYATIEFDCLQIGTIPKLGESYSEIMQELFGFKSGKHIIFYQFNVGK